MNKKYLATGFAIAMLTSVILWGCDNSRHGEHMEEAPGDQQGEHMENTAAEHQENTALEGGHAEHGTDAAEEKKESGTETVEKASLSGEIKDGVRVITVKARQFEFDPATIVVEKGEKVRLEVTSEDVTHGIGISEFDINQTLKPEKTEIIEFQPDKAGTYHFHCTVYCGSGHGKMHGELVVIEGK